MSDWMKKYTIGVLGGMGTYATIYLFQRYAELFPAVKEWDRPRIIIDNNCTMPSRVRAALYGEKKEELVKEMVESISCLMKSGAQRIVLACNTSHIFLPEVYKQLPQAQAKVMNIIDACVDKLSANAVKEVYLLATEGTILSGVYHSKLQEAGIGCKTPSQDEFVALRRCIEAVKQNKFGDEVRELFTDFVGRDRICVLGCTELPILYKKYISSNIGANIYDPLEIAMSKLHEEYMEYI